MSIPIASTSTNKGSMTRMKLASPIPTTTTRTHAVTGRARYIHCHATDRLPDSDGLIGSCLSRTDLATAARFHAAAQLPAGPPEADQEQGNAATGLREAGRHGAAEDQAHAGDPHHGRGEGEEVRSQVSPVHRHASTSALCFAVRAAFCFSSRYQSLQIKRCTPR